ncbi:MAG: hypothetical protein HOC74_20585 [Gemmatimonadetes bacterium]|nr:hypothetical protein [Gemmatimonadota bacterium]
MSPKISFSQYLVGHASLERPPFFYAYAGMWLHLIVGSALVLFFTSLPFILTITSMTIGSFCLGIAIYGLFSREYGLLLNLASYASSMGRLVYPRDMSSIFLVIAILAALVSGYFLLSREYRRYNINIFDDRTCRVPAWISITMGMVVVLICVYGLYLV